MYSDPGFMISVGGAAFFMLIGTFLLAAARSRARTTRLLEQHGKATGVEITDIRFQPLTRWRGSYGLVSFTYEYEGKEYTRRQALEELSAQALLKGSTHPCVLVLPEKPRCARLAYSGKFVYDDSTIGRDTVAGILLILLPFIIVGVIVVIGSIGV